MYTWKLKINIRTRAFNPNVSFTLKALRLGRVYREEVPYRTRSFISVFISLFFSSRSMARTRRSKLYIKKLRS